MPKEKKKFKVKNFHSEQWTLQFLGCTVGKIWKNNAKWGNKYWKELNIYIYINDESKYM